MKRQMLFKKVFTTTLLCCTLWNTACVNHIDDDEEIQEGKVPITFSIKMGSATTKVNNNLFEKGDKAGLYAILSGGDITGTRYIDNLELTCGSENTLIPSKAIFYPEGEDTALDFISYYPYSVQGAIPGSSTIPVAIQRDQSSSKGYSQSDFLVAKAAKKTSSPNAIELQYQHQLTKIKIALIPSEDEDADQMLKDNPRIIASGFSTHAEYDLAKGTFSNISEAADIIVSGTWKIDENNRLTGKEFIVIPQAIDTKQSLQMEWNGRIYNCTIPTLEEVSNNTQYEIDITSMQTSSNILNGVVGTIEEWPSEVSMENTNNNGSYAVVHIPVLSFSQSNVYRIYSNGKSIAEICKEYLVSEALTSRAIVTYPIKEDGITDLSQGTVLQLLDTEESINGGIVCWDKDKNSFEYAPGTSPAIEEVYFDKNGNPLTVKPETPVNVNILKYVIRDTREGLQEYPIVKIGTQYWMRKDLCATTYQDGSPIPNLDELGKGASYFKPKDYNIYFYNGEAVDAKELSPQGWKIPSKEDWKKLDTYVNSDASLLKAGEWQFAGYDDGTEIAPVSNLTMLSVYPSGMWFQNRHANAYKMIGFWSWDQTTHAIPEQTVFFMGQSNEIIWDQTLSTGKDYYKGLSIRCIKE